MDLDLSDQEVFDKCLEKWGLESQLVQTIEELSELIQSISKIYRFLENEGDTFLLGLTVMHDLKGKDLETLQGIIEEIADTELMLDQLKYFFLITDDEISEKRESKKRRLIEIVS